MDEIQLVTLEQDHAGAAATLIAQAFRDELITCTAIDMDNPRARDLYACASEIRVLRHLIGEHPLLGAMEESELVAVAAMRSPHGDASLIDTIRIALPRVWGLRPLMRYVRFRNVFRNLGTLSMLHKLPEHVPTPHYTIDVLAVAPEKQGRGLGRRLMDWAYELAGSDPAACGVYLFTAGTRNLTVYERLGYTVLHRQMLNCTNVYHMFRTTETS